MHQRSTLNTWKDLAVQAFTVLLLGQNQASSRASHGFMGRGCNIIGTGHRRGMDTCCHQPGNMGHIHHKEGINLISYCAKCLKINKTGIGTGTSHNHSGPVFMSDTLHFLHVDHACFLINSIRYEIEKLSREVDWTTMGEVSTMGEIHAQHLVAGVQCGKINSHICLAAGMGLNISIFRLKQFPGSVDCQIFYNIGIITTAIIALTGIPFGILIGEDRTLRLKYCLTDDIFRSNKFKIVALTIQFISYSSVDLGIKAF